MTLKELAKVFLWDVFNPSILKLKKNRKYKIKDQIHGINIGCGIDNPNHWLGIDGGATHYLFKLFPKFILNLLFKGFNMSNNYTFTEYYKKIRNINMIHHDLKYGLPFINNSVGNVYSSHFFEHLFYDDAEKLLQECYRVLKGGGCIRICVPSLDKEVESIEYALTEYKKGNINPIQKYVSSDKVGHISGYSVHRQMYNYEKLYLILTDSGFTQVMQCDYKYGRIPDVELLDTRNDGLYIEGVKPISHNEYDK